jgi:hypothetical protein
MRRLMLICLMFTGAMVMAQGKKEDVIYLNNGGVLRGTRLSDSLSMIRIRTADGSIWVYPLTDVKSVQKEASYNSYAYKPKGFGHFTELGPLVAGKTTIDGVTTAAFSFQTVNGYKFQPYLFSGLGVGVDLYATQTVIPVFGSIRGDLYKQGSVIPFYFVDAGYGFNITQNSSTGTDFKGGLLYAGGIGIKIPFNRSAGFLLSFGYRYQQTSYLQEGVDNHIKYRRLAIRAGFWL